MSVGEDRAKGTKAKLRVAPRSCEAVSLWPPAWFKPDETIETLPIPGTPRPLPGWRTDLATWSADRREAWAERAARLEYDGGLPREAAEYLSFIHQPATVQMTAREAKAARWLMGWLNSHLGGCLVGTVIDEAALVGLDDLAIEGAFAAWQDVFLAYDHDGETYWVYSERWGNDEPHSREWLIADYRRVRREMDADKGRSFGNMAVALCPAPATPPPAQGRIVEYQLPPELANDRIAVQLAGMMQHELDTTGRRDAAAMVWLAEQLAAGPRPHQEILAMGQAERFSPHLLDGAAYMTEAKRFQLDGVWYWGNS